MSRISWQRAVHIAATTMLGAIALTPIAYVLGLIALTVVCTLAIGHVPCAPYEVHGLEAAPAGYGPACRALEDFLCWLEGDSAIAVVAAFLAPPFLPVAAAPLSRRTFRFAAILTGLSAAAWSTIFYSVVSGPLYWWFF